MVDVVLIAIAVVWVAVRLLELAVDVRFRRRAEAAFRTDHVQLIADSRAVLAELNALALHIGEVTQDLWARAEQLRAMPGPPGRHVPRPAPPAAPAAY